MKFATFTICLLYFFGGNSLASGTNSFYKNKAYFYNDKFKPGRNFHSDIPSAPVLISPPANDKIGVNDTALEWHGAAGANSYHLQIAINSANFPMVVEDTTITKNTTISLLPLIVPKLRVDAKYYWYVSASCSGTIPLFERPKVIYNLSTHKYVMWMHKDAVNYSAAEAGIVISDKSTGPFKYLGAERPNGRVKTQRYGNWELSSNRQLPGIKINIHKTPRQFVLSQKYPNSLIRRQQPAFPGGLHSDNTQPCYLDCI